MKNKGDFKVLHQTKMSIMAWIFFESNYAFTFSRHFFEATDLTVPEIVRMKCVVLSDCYSLAIKACAAYSCVALAHAEAIFEGLLQVARIKMFRSSFKLSCLIGLEFVLGREQDGTTDAV